MVTKGKHSTGYFKHHRTDHVTKKHTVDIGAGKPTRTRRGVKGSRRAGRR